MSNCTFKIVMLLLITSMIMYKKFLTLLRGTAFFAPSHGVARFVPFLKLTLWKNESHHVKGLQKARKGCQTFWLKSPLPLEKCGMSRA